jgi:hypothetical protein
VHQVSKACRSGAAYRTANTYDEQIGLGSVACVIGSYEVGADTADVLYSVRFSDATEALYPRAA